MKDKLKELKNMRDIQCSKGNFDQSEYMRGLANGLILAVAITESKEPNYFDKPKKEENILTSDKKNKWVAFFLALFLGGFGVHKFYLKQTGLGILYLLFCWTYVPAFLGLIEAISLASYTQDNFNKKFNS